MKKVNRSRADRRARILAWLLAFTLMVPWNAIAMAAESTDRQTKESADEQAENAGARQAEAVLQETEAGARQAEVTSQKTEAGAQQEETASQKTVTGNGGNTAEVNVISANGTVINVPVDDEIQGSGDIGTVFSPAGLLGPYTVSFYQQDPESEDAPENNLIAEYKEVAYDTELSEEIDSLQSEYPQYIGAEWNLAGNYKVTNNLDVWLIDANAAASIGGETYETLQAAINALGTTGVDGTEIVLLKDVKENVKSESKNYTLDMQGYTITSAAANKSVYTIIGGKVTLKDGTITGADIDKLNCPGGGIYAENADLTLSNMKVTNNVLKMSGCSGGGIYMKGGSLRTEAGTVISDNQLTVSVGGGICLDNNSFYTAENTKINDNQAGGSGGGICAKAGCNVTFLSGCEVKNNRSGVGGGGIYFGGNKLEALNGLVVSGNTETSKEAAGLYLAAGHADLTDVEIINNQFTGTNFGYGALSLSSGVSLNASDCTFQGNSGTKAAVNILAGSASFTNCTFTGNKVTNGSAIRLEKGNASFTGCSIKGNTAERLNENSNTKSAGALELVSDSGKGAGVTLSDTVITDNAGGTTGGILACGNNNSRANCTIKMTGGALYGNITADENGANDLWLSKSISYATENEVAMPAANMMSDGSMSFAEYSWVDKINGYSIDGPLLKGALYGHYKDTKDEFFLTAGLKRYVAQIKDTEEKFETVTGALEKAGNDTEVFLIAGDNDDTGNTIIEDVEIPYWITSITLDMNNGHSIQGKSKSAIRISGTPSKLNLKGEGTVRAYGSAYDIENYGTLTIGAEVDVSSVDHKSSGSKPLILLGETQVKKVKLAENKYITAGKDFSIKDSMTIILEDTVLDKLIEANGYTVTLIEEGEGSKLTDEIAEKISIQDTGGQVKNDLLMIKKKDNAIVASKIDVNGVYLDGVRGVDPVEGEEDPTLGLIREKPVKTFEAAKKLLEEKNKEPEGKKLEGIYVMNTVTISGNETWQLDGEDVRLMRDPLFKGALIEISGGNTLTLEDITIDGRSDLLKASSALIYMSGGTLNITEGAKLTNNNRTRSAGYGGAVEAENAEVTMTGGIISCNHAWHGGGICLHGRHSRFNMSGGRIAENMAENTADKEDSGGGGVAVLMGAQMTLSGGFVSENKADCGAGISVGGRTTKTVGDGGAALAMTGGTVEKNIADHEGGGIYLQCANTADVSGGSIVRNESHGGQFGGGGIYVNGSRAVDGNIFGTAVLHLYNAQITGNKIEDGSSANDGGGYAGCATSVTYIYPNSAAIYGNTVNGAKNDVLFSYNAANMGNYPEYEVSGFMYDGTPYHWKDELGNELSASIYQNNQANLVLHTDAIPSRDGAVLISGNTAKTKGGGIGSNGTVYFGSKPDTTTEISVTKVWNDAGYENLRPDSIDIWILRDDVKVEKQTIKPEGEKWPKISFTNLPKKDSAGKDYVYTVEEELSGDAAGRYKSEVSGSAAGGFTVTNHLVGSLSISKTTNNAVSPENKGKEFTFTVELKKGGEPFIGSVLYEKVKTDGSLKIGSGALEFKEGDGGKKNVTLADGQTITLKEVPYDLTYTVTETKAAGYTVKVNGKEGNAVSGQIVSGEGTGTKVGAAAVFGNIYTVTPITVTIAGTKVLTGREWTTADTFAFELTETTEPEDEETEVPDALGNVLTATATEASKDFSFEPINYTVPYVHTYAVSETSESGRGITADGNTYTVTVTVTDNGDGTMSAAVVYPQKETDAEGKETAAAKVTFTNTYTAGGTTAVINGTKVLAGRDWTDKDAFSFVLTETTELKAGERAVPDALKDVLTATATEASKDFSFGPINYTVPYVHTYEVSETSQSGRGITVDGNTYTVTVTVTDNGDGTMSAAVAYPQKETDAEGKETAAAKVTFTNTYTASGTTAVINGTKVLTGREWTDSDTFKIVLEETTAETEPDVANRLEKDMEATVKKGATDFAFEIPYTKAGTHTYQIYEADYTVAGVSKDATIYTMTVEVTDNGDGTLTAAKIITKPGEGERAGVQEVQTADFTNTYTVDSTTAVINGTKILAGREWTDEDLFSFELTETTQPKAGEMIVPDALEDALPATATKASKDFSFGPISYTVPYVHTYAVRETSQPGRGIIVDGNTCTVTVTVTDNGDGTMNAAVAYPQKETNAEENETAAKVIFTNIYSAAGTTAVITGSKSLTGREWTDRDVFEIVLKETTVKTEPDVADYLKADMKATVKKGAADFAFEIPYTKAGTHTYQIYEADHTVAGVSKDATVYTVTVEVTDNGNGTLTATTTIMKPVIEAGVTKQETVEAVTFENIYNAAGKAVITGSKSLIGREWTNSDVFEIVLKETTVETKPDVADRLKENMKATVKSGETGFTFEIPYTKAGIHTYQVYEADHTVAGVTKDATVYTVTVEVTDNGNGTLTAAKTITKPVTEAGATKQETVEAVTFENIYNAAGKAVITGSKSLTGREWTDEDSFKIVLAETTELDVADRLEADMEATVEKDATGFTFEIPYTKEGTHTYRIYEADHTVAGVSKDATVYTVTVEVTDNGNGTLTAAKTITKPGEGEGAEAQEVQTANFTNTYTVGSTTAVVNGTKVLAGREWTNEDIFSFELTETTQPKAGETAVPDALEDALKATATEASKDFRFGPISYTVPYVHTYAVKETSQPGRGIIVDGNTCTVTVTVTDNGDGTMNAAVTYPRKETNAEENETAAEVIFTNIYSAAGTTAVITGSKSLTGREWTDEDSFKIVLAETTVETEPDVADRLEADMEAIVEKNATDFTFEIPYTKTGTHTYRIYEADHTVAGVSKDATVYTVTVEVTDNGNGALEANTTITKPGEGEGAGAQEVQTADFTNTYTVGSITAAVNGSKSLTGREWTDEDSFRIVLAETTETTEPDVADRLEADMETTVRKGAADFAFEIPYTKAGTHTYRIYEADHTVAAVSKDATIYTMTVEVTDNGDGTLTAAKTITKPGEGEGAGAQEVQTADFINTYAAAGKAVITGSKSLTGREWTDSDAFKIVLAETTETPEPDVADRLEADMEAIVEKDATDFTFEIPYTKAGTHTYRIYEADHTVAGVSKDATVYTVTVEVTDNGDGTLEANTTITKPGEGEGAGTQEVQTADFTNTYTVGSATAAINGTKVLEGREWTDEDTFSFALTETTQPKAGETEIPDMLLTALTATASKASKDFSFGPINYTVPYVHTYAVRETSESGRGITADGNTYTVTVTVTDNGDGTMSAAVAYPQKETGVEGNETAAAKVTFTNVYKAEDTSLALQGTKVLAGSRTEPLLDDEFHFIMKEGEKVIGTVGNRADGSITFPEITYTAADIGEHVYEISEVRGDEAHVTYSDKVFTVHVTVTDKNDGTLDAQAVYPEGGIIFENIYTPGKHTEASLDVTKLLYALEGHPLIADDITFYVALFADEARTQRISEVQELHYAQSASATAAFRDLQPDRTYYIGETDAFGVLKEDGMIGDTIYAAAYPDGDAVTLTREHSHGHIAMQNTFYDVPGGFYYGGELTITKNVTLGGEEHATDDTFYAAVFEDKELTQRVGDVAALWMDGTSMVRRVLPVYVGISEGETVTYYVAETDAEGNVLDPDAGIGFTISIDHPSVTMSVASFRAAVTITNDFTEEEIETEIETETETETEFVTEAETESETEASTEAPTEVKAGPSNPASPRTGDDTPVGLYLLLLAASLAALAAASAGKRSAGGKSK